MKKTTTTRTEEDSLGAIKVPKEAYFGAFTVRAQNNFQISGITAPKLFQKALGLVKLAAAQTNSSLGLLEKNHAKAIEQACREFTEGKFDHQFTLDVFQAGAGTSYNMNANEIIANRANEILKSPKGKYQHINPNNHVNIAQSTNDVIPTSTRIAILLALPALITELKALTKEFDKKARENKNVIKVGRTHLQDAVPITLGQELDSYSQALKKSQNFIMRQAKQLKILGIGGTAVGTGINTDPQYRPLIVKNLSSLSGIKFHSGKNLTEMANNMTEFLNFSATLRSLATNLLNISNDLKLMNMGPKGGLGEIMLPEVQAGSSIMPGKVNPSVPECLEMICFQVCGNDKTVEMAAQRSQFELNVMCPVIMYNLLQSMEILTNGMNMFRKICLQPMKINKEKIKQTFEGSLALATALSPYIGYLETAKIVKTALKNNVSLRSEVKRRKLLNDEKLNKILSVERTTRPSKKLP